MERDVTSAGFHERLRVVVAFLWPLLALGFVLRVALYVSFRDESFALGTFVRVIATGFALDVAANLLLLTPLVLGVSLFSGRLTWRRALVAWAVGAGIYALVFVGVDREFGRLHALVTLVIPLVVLLSTAASWLVARRATRTVLMLVLFSAAVFGTVVEYYFFEEFNSRYNHIALDYVLYPSEVVTNIWESYPVVWFVAGSVALGAVLTWLASRSLPREPLRPPTWHRAFTRGAAAIAVLVACVAVAGLVPAAIVENRITSETAQNGLVQLVRAFRTSELDYELYYATLPRPEARARAAQVLGFPAPSAEEATSPLEAFELQRRVTSAREPGAGALDVVVVLQESLGSNFVGALGAVPPDLTPCIDRWSKEGLLFENLVANGNRTVRGLEGVLCSFVPLPGDSITKRTPPADAATLARVYKSAGYETVFLYGGAGTFDGMEPFMSKNGWDTFVEQRDYPDGCFTTAWGVADEHIFDALLERQVAAAKAGRRFFGTLMSVSNHKPYLVPSGRTPIADGPPSRRGAVSYSDWAIGHWLDAARERGLLEHTLVLIVGDHGARVYGRELIPVESYRIPALFLSPDARWKGKRYARLCSQVDLGPTLLAMSGLDATVPFLGRDLSSLEDGPGRAFVQHNRDVGILTDDALVVLGLQKTATFYTRTDRGSAALTRVAPGHVDARLRELERDATAVFQTAYEVYRAGRYVPPAR